MSPKPRGPEFGEGADLQQPRRVQRAPEPLARAIPYRETVGIVHAETEVVVLGAVLCVKQEHRGQRRQAEVSDLLSHEDRCLDVDRAHVARADGEAVGARGARPVEQRVHHHAVAGRRLDPVGAEERKLLPLRLAGADREAAGAHAESLIPRDRLKVAGAGEDHEGRQGVGLVQAGQAAETGEVDRRTCLRSLHGAVVIESGIEADAPGDAALHHRDLHREVVDEAGVQEVDREARGRVGKEPLGVTVADDAVVLS